MSSGSHDAHASADHDHAFDGEPTDVLSAGEPPTAGWVPALGAALFAVATVAFLVTREPAPKAPDAVPAEKAAPVAVAPAAPAPPATQLREARVLPTPAPPAPTASGADAALRRLSPDQIRALQKQVVDMKAKPGAAGRAPAPPLKH